MPVRVDQRNSREISYSVCAETLTEPGRALRATVDLICDWTHHHFGHIEGARRRFDS
ncbi:hypothetical protein [Nonomuraea cavernae]|uniref:hypothetical protein n=1 Tax=Nonomuraea cavernae TaxID=2045107 RepID=UPI0033D0AF0E